MWALQRASVRLSLRNRGLSSGTSQILCVKPEIANYLKDYNLEVIKSQGKQLDKSLYSSRFYKTSFSSSKSYAKICIFHSQADAKSGKGQDDDLGGDFSELEKHHASGDEIDDNPLSESNLVENINDHMMTGLDQLGTKTGNSEKISPEPSAPSTLTQFILSTHAPLVGEALDKWVKEGHEVTQAEVSSTMFYLRNRKMYFKALQLSEWLESTQHLELTKKHYATQVDLIAKVRGIHAAEKYFQNMPESFRSAIVYTTLLANCVSLTDVKKSEQLFKLMKKLFPITIFACNQLLLLYKKTDKRKIASILKLMEEENIKRSIFTYQILIDVKRLANDTTGMEHLVAMMKSEGLEANSQIRASLARHYAAIGHKDKAEAVIKEMGGDDLIKERWLCQILLPLYATLGREDEVGRIWKVCEPTPRWTECLAAIEAWGLLNRIEKAEEAFEALGKKIKRPSGEHYAVLLNMYVNHGLVEKGKELVRRMMENNTSGGPFMWDALVKLHIKAKEVEKADLILEKAMKQGKAKPLFTSYLLVLNQYAKKGNVRSAERMLGRIRQAGYTNLLWAYQSVLMAYVNAKVPVYGFWDRLKGDNVAPSDGMRRLLMQNDPFTKSPLDELLNEGSILR